MSAANRLPGGGRSETGIVVVNRAGEHVSRPGLTGVLSADAEPAAARRPVASLLADTPSDFSPEGWLTSMPAGEIR